MSGHSKWATIRHKKGAADAKRGKVFTKLIKEIMVAARMGGGDPDSNPRLRAVVLKARGANMPKDNVERAIKKGTGELEGSVFSELVYEGYGAGGVAIMVETLTDNRNRTAADVRSIFTKNGGNLGAENSVSYMFKRKGVISYDASLVDEDKILEIALDAGADDVTNEGGIIEVVTSPSGFEAVLNALESAKLAHESAEISLVADQTVSIDKDTARKVLKLVDLLEDNDDVQTVSTNLDLPDDFDPDE